MGTHEFVLFDAEEERLTEKIEVIIEMKGNNSLSKKIYWRTILFQA